MTFRAKIGHAHLKVRDLERAIDFYRRTLNLQVNDRWGDQYVFLTGTAMHHEIALQQVGAHAPQPPAGATGLFHVAFEVPNRHEFGAALRQLRNEGIAVAVVDHIGISWAMYFSDPDDNGLEIYWDTRDGDLSARWLGNRPLSDEEIFAPE